MEELDFVKVKKTFDATWLKLEFAGVPASSPNKRLSRVVASFVRKWNI